MDYWLFGLLVIWITGYSDYRLFWLKIFLDQFSKGVGLVRLGLVRLGSVRFGLYVYLIMRISFRLLVIRNTGYSDNSGPIKE